MSEYIDFLIVGGGLAGLHLQHELRQAGHRTLLFDQPLRNDSTVIAAGIVNPVAGKYFALSWRAADFFPRLEEHYRDLEGKWGASFFHPKPLFRLLANAGEQNQWLSKAHLPKYEGFCRYHSAVEGAPFGMLEMAHGGHLDTGAFVQAGQRAHANEIRHEAFDHQLLDPLTGTYRDWRFGKLIFCEGNAVRSNPFFRHLPFTVNKGEVLDIHSDELPEDRIHVGGVFVLPVGAQQFKVGASYDHTELGPEPTEKARNYLLERFERMFQVNYEVLDQKVGIRPAVRDRRPIMGAHPAYPKLYIFNGLGSKGVSMTPQLAREMFAHLTENAKLHADCLIDRFD